jgi:uncharacterized protein (TIGR01244 family)
MHAQARVLTFLAAAALAVAAFASGVDSVESFYRVDDRVATGAQPTPEQVTSLADEGFQTIINLREEAEFNDGPQARAARDAGMLFLRVPVSKQQPTDAAVDKFLAVTDDESVYPVFIYCGSGNRAAGLWMIRRVLRDGWALADAEAEADRAGLKSAELRDFARDYIRRHAANE